MIETAMRSRRVRAYALIGGRTRPRHHLLVETLISVPHYNPQFSATLLPESRALYELARETIARRFVNGFADPSEYQEWFLDPDKADNYLGAVTSGQRA